MNQLVSFDFPPTPVTRWQEQAARELKGTDLAALSIVTPEGLTLKPYYTAEDLESVPLAAIQAAQKAVPSWENRVAIPEIDERTANERAREALAGGANGLMFFIDNPDVDLARLLHGIKLSDTPARFQLGTAVLPTAFLGRLRRVTGYPPKGSLATEDVPVADLLRLTADAPGFRPLVVEETEESPAAPEFLAEVLGRLVRYLDVATEAAFAPVEVFSRVEVSLSTSPDYFLTLSKVRALRFLLAHLQRAYGIEKPVPVFVQASVVEVGTEVRPPEAEDLIRATLQGLAVLAAGCDAITVVARPLESVGTSARLSRNIPLILEAEGYLSAVADPAAGSYFLETLTWNLAQRTWALFLGANNEPT